MFCNSPPCCNDAGFLQKNNSLDEKTRMVGAFKESAKNQLTCDNSEHFSRAETDFSNLFARGNDESFSFVMLFIVEYLNQSKKANSK